MAGMKPDSDAPVWEFLCWLVVVLGVGLVGTAVLFCVLEGML